MGDIATNFPAKVQGEAVFDEDRRKLPKGTTMVIPTRPKE
jgi:hypothetical protein